MQSYLYRDGKNNFQPRPKIAVYFILNKIDEISEIKMRQIPKVHDTFKNFFRLADAQQKQAEEQRDIFEKWNIENSLYHSVWRR